MGGAVSAVFESTGRPRGEDTGFPAPYHQIDIETVLIEIGLKGAGLLRVNEVHSVIFSANRRFFGGKTIFVGAKI